jgi:pectin methylesterase-like acyl-CoA thioesterase
VNSESLRVCCERDHECQFTTIQAAINAASDRATIKIDAGTYRENLIVDPAHTKAMHLTLVGAEPEDVIVDG